MKDESGNRCKGVQGGKDERGMRAATRRRDPSCSLTKRETLGRTQSGGVSNQRIDSRTEGKRERRAVRTVNSSDNDGPYVHVGVQRGMKV